MDLRRGQYQELLACQFPQYGEKDDIATIDIQEEDLRLLPDGMNAVVNEEIKAQFDALEKGKKAENVSKPMI